MRALSKVVVLSSLLLLRQLRWQAREITKAPAPTHRHGSSDRTPAPAPAPARAGSGRAGRSASVKPEDMPTAVRMRRLEQKTQALKERAWQLKARVQMLKEQMLGGGVGAQALITHANEMGSSFRLVKLIYTLDGTQIFARTDDSGENLYKTKSFDIFTGPISPGNHKLAMVATYRGHGYGVFEYLSKYTFTANATELVHRRRGQDLARSSAAASRRAARRRRWRSAPRSTARSPRWRRRSRPRRRSRRRRAPRRCRPPHAAPTAAPAGK